MSYSALKKWLNGAEDIQKLCGEVAVSILRAISRRTFLVYLALGLARAPSLTGSIFDLLGRQPMVYDFQ